MVEFGMLLAGDLDHGNASIVNGLLRDKVFNEQEMCVEGVHTKEQLFHGVSTNVTAVLGLGCSQHIRPIEINSNCPRARLGIVLYCIPIQPDKRFNEDSVKGGMRKITTAYDDEIWKNAVVVFLHAPSEDIEKERFKELTEIWKTRVIRITSEFIRPKFMKKIGFVATGEVDKPVLPDGSFWFSTLWSNVYYKGTDSCQKAIERLLDETNGWMSLSDMRENFETIRLSVIWEQPICKDAKSLKTKIAIGLGIGGAAVGAVATGATVGALIGALAIGIPSFGVAAGAGLVLGGAIGGGIGLGVVGAATGGATAIKKYQDEKLQNKLLREQNYVGDSQGERTQSQDGRTESRDGRTESQGASNNGQDKQPISGVGEPPVHPEKEQKAVLPVATSCEMRKSPRLSFYDEK